MGSQGLVYSNARVKSMENSLLSSEKITRMSFASSLEEGVKILYESNYGAVVLDNPYMFEKVLSSEQVIFSDFFREAMPYGSGLESFLIVNDYHNAKALIKAKFMQTEVDSSTLAPQGMIKIEELKSWILEENYFKMPVCMSKAIKEIANYVAVNGVSPRMIDITIDKASFEDVLQTISKTKSKSINKYWISTIDLINISGILRCMIIGANEKFFNEMFIKGGNLGLNLFSGLMSQNVTSVYDKFRFSDYGKLVEIAVEEAKNNLPLTKFEVAWDNYLMEIFKIDKNDIFSVAPIAGFYVAKKIELKVVRMILVALKNKVDTGQIKMRLRGFYA